MILSSVALPSRLESPGRYRQHSPVSSVTVWLIHTGAVVVVEPLLQA